MNNVIGETGKGALAAIEEDFHFIGGGILANAFEDIGGFVFSQHSALENSESMHRGSDPSTRRPFASERATFAQDDRGLNESNSLCTLSPPSHSETAPGTRHARFP
jgi:hypothetical protein